MSDRRRGRDRPIFLSGNMLAAPNLQHRRVTRIALHHAPQVDDPVEQRLV
jgi:hypothetical protein